MGTETQTIELNQLVGESPVKPAPQVKMSFNMIVPDDLQMELLDLRDNIRNNSFKVGDIAWKVMQGSLERGLNVSQSMVWAAVGSFVGYSSRTIRYFAETASFYPKSIRDKYDILPFSHFVYARYKGDKWQDVLDYAMANPGISEGELDYWYKTEILGEHTAPLPDVLNNPPAKSSVASVPLAAQSTSSTDLILLLNDVVQRADQLLSTMDDEGGVVQEIARHISSIKVLIPLLADSNM